MHFTFIPYGARQEVERLFRDIEAQKFKLKLWKKGKKDIYVWLTGQIRVLPFGVYDVVFPKEYRDTLLNTLVPNEGANQRAELRYDYIMKVFPKMLKAMFRKTLKLKAVPKFEQKEKFLWSTENVTILGMGIREDREDLKEAKDMGYKGWYHEAL